MFIYSIYDKAVKSYTVPFFAESDEMAQRILMNSFSKDSQLVMYPASYQLFCLGEFDDKTGVVTGGIENPVCGLVHLIPDGLVDFVLDGSFKK